jgi:antitoxin component YwqK of YwqJK toxin-antitoxin module
MIFVNSVMKISAILFLAVFSFCKISFGQSRNERMLFVIDSIPLLNDPEEWNPILQEDIADIEVIRNKDTLDLLGYSKMDGVAYVFTKEYRNRPDSLKKIPSLKQMEMKNDGWYFHGNIYSGKYVDYYNSGRIQNEATLSNGKLDGALIVYFKNGNKKSISHYKNGILEGVWNDYYTNGALMQTRDFSGGNLKKGAKIYFINGQIQNEIKFKNSTSYDTAFTYFSSGKVRQMSLIKNDRVVPDKKQESLNYYTTMFNQSINAGNIKEANLNFYKIWGIDSTNIDTYFKSGLLMLKEFRFDEAIGEFNKALQIEPLMRESLVYRALGRLQKYQLANTKLFLKDNPSPPLRVEDIMSIPEDEQEKICADVRQAVYLDFSELYVRKIIPEAILNYCQQKNH